MVRYGLVSVVSAVIAFTILTLVYGVLQLWSEVPSALFSNILATFPNYYLNRRWVWGKSGGSHLWREVVPFLGHVDHRNRARPPHGVAPHNFSDAHDLSHVARTVVIVGANTAAFGILWILKFLILNRLFRSLPVDGETGSLSATDGSDHGTVTVQDGGGAKGGTVALNVQLAEGLPE